MQGGSFSLALDKFWKDTPNFLKYIIIFGIIILAGYFIFARKINGNQEKELEQLQQGITISFRLMDELDEYKKEQALFNSEVINKIDNLYSLINELSVNENKKFSLILNSGSKNKDVLVDKLDLMNDNFDRLMKAYDVKDKEKPTVTPDMKIRVRKMNDSNDPSQHP